MRQALMLSAPDLARATWEPGDKRTQPTGDVVWSDSKQKGYVRLSGLPKNDPARRPTALDRRENQDPKTRRWRTFDINSMVRFIPIDAK
jgi:hypothetical protein